ncbi:hypothetical protein LTR56_016847 [Elasticomyces elasticus]|nr:hypothetical protein LTR56_016847 [Elasticomyces elasticus]KAK3666667.1 hypothetical protein LTR22_002616 [Elasticomyces elasticus]KAK4921640.1 hypothetical protein LTR49_010926 [Elasticomyces elasticus]KAK5758584.1 hypothetical protein LTS12_011283 [Elasticomyces elasticus]
MELAAAASVVTIVSTVLKHGNTVVELYLSLKDARSEVDERITQVRSHWQRTRVQIEFIERTWTTLRPEHQTNQTEILTLLNSKLKYAERKVQGLVKKKQKSTDDRPKVKRWKYVFLKSYLDNVINDLAKWQTLYDPSWYLIMTVASPMIDAELGKPGLSRSPEGTAVLDSAKGVREAAALKSTPDSEKNVFLPAVERADLARIRYSSTLVMRRPTSSSAIHHRSCTLSNGRLYWLRSSRHPAAGIKVKTSGSKDFWLTSFHVVFKAPSSGDPHTLREHLTNRTDHTLTERMTVAKRLATSVSYVHTLGFVHKNIRPENILGFSSDDVKLGAFYLIGFEQIRSADGKTYMRGDDELEKNLYRHPERQGPHPEEAYVMQHDIYSLGACLLEIGLWDTFVKYNPKTDIVEAPGLALELSLEELRRKRPNAIKDHLVALAKRKLPQLMGEIYTEVVISCLTCLDEDSLDYGDEEDAGEKADDVLVGVRFIEQVLMKLNEILV